MSAQQNMPLDAFCQPLGAHAAGEQSNVSRHDEEQLDTDMANAEHANFEMEDAHF